MIGGHRFRTTADPRRHSDAVGVAEVGLRERAGLPVDHFRHDGAVHVRQQLERVAVLEERCQSAL